MHTKNYFKAAWRNLIKSKNISLSLATGLIIGVLWCLLIWLTCKSFELSFDQVHKMWSNSLPTANKWPLSKRKAYSMVPLLILAIGMMQDDFDGVVNHTTCVRLVGPCNHFIIWPKFDRSTNGFVVIFFHVLFYSWIGYSRLAKARLKG